MKLYKDRNWLYQKYIIERLSTYEISKIIKAVPSTIWKWLKIFNIKTRTIGETRKGKLLPEKVKRKISQTNSGQNHPWFGRHHTEESKEKKRQAMKEWHKKHPDAQRGKNNPNFGRRGKNWPNWAGEKTIQNNYVYVYKPDHSYSNKYGRVAEHRLITEKALGRYLKSNEVVHHINENPSDNRNCNLLICTNSYHQFLHRRMEYLKNGEYAFEHAKNVHADGQAHAVCNRKLGKRGMIGRLKIQNQGGDAGIRFTFFLWLMLYFQGVGRLGGLVTLQLGEHA